MVEPEVVGYDLQKICGLAEDMVKHTVQATLSNNTSEYSALQVDTSVLGSIVDKVWPSVPYEDACKLLPDVTKGEGLSSEQEKALTVNLK